MSFLANHFLPSKSIKMKIPNAVWLSQDVVSHVLMSGPMGGPPFQITWFPKSLLVYEGRWAPGHLAFGKPCYERLRAIMRHLSVGPGLAK